MRLLDAVVGESYHVVSQSSCETLQVGDLVTVYKDGGLGCRQAGGWLLKGEWEGLDAEIEPINGLADGAGI